MTQNSDDDLFKIGNDLGLEKLKLSAGCAGFAEVLAMLLGFNKKVNGNVTLNHSFFLVCGSVNPVTKNQVLYAQSKGFKRICLSVEQKLNPDWLNTNDCKIFVDDCFNKINNSNAILDANHPNDESETQNYISKHNLSINDVRLRISQSITKVTKLLLDKGLDATLMCVGGDTLLALMKSVGVSELVPVREIEKGVVLTSFVYNSKKYFIMTKSGGFGEQDLLCKISEFLIKS